MKSESVRWHKGRYYPHNIPSSSSGYRLGDGVFETIRTYYGKPFRLGAHISRLLAGARSIGLRDLPDYDIVVKEVIKTLEEKSTSYPDEEWILRPIFFSDSLSWGFTVLIESWKPRIDSHKSDRISVGISIYRHPGGNLVPPSAKQQVKWLSRGPLSHSLRDAREKGWEEALLLDSKKKVIEGTRSNVFVVHENSVIAPGIRSGAFPGITRDAVIECAGRRGIEVTDRPISLQEAQNSNELFITSTLLGILPVGRLIVGKNTYNISKGEISKMLISDFEQMVAEETHSKAVS